MISTGGREGVRHAHHVIFGAVNRPHGVIEDQDEGVADQQLHQDVAAIDPAHEQPLEHDAERRDSQRPGRDRQREAAGQAVGGEGEVGAEHIERAVGEVDDPEHAEDQRQAGRHQEQQHAHDQPGRRLRHRTGGGAQAAHERVEVQGQT